MKQVLLAINGDIPTSAVFHYSVGLCKRINAELNILQFVKEEKLAQCISNTKKRVKRLGKLLEDSFAGIAFAEEGLPEMASEFLSEISGPLKELIKVNPPGLSLKVAVSNGNPEIELSNYIDKHQDIILTVFDPSGDQQNLPKHSLALIERIRRKLGVPLVVVKSS